MSPSFIGNSVVTQRDRKVFRFLFESKAATTEQLVNIFFPKTAPSTARRRLIKLKRQGWLRRERYEDEYLNQYVYGITDRAYEKYVLAPGENDRRKQLRSDSLEHDLALVDIRRSLEMNRSVKSFVTENLLQSCEEFLRTDDFMDYVSIRSDGVVELLIQEKHRFVVPVEYEASIKTTERCLEKLDRYYTRSDARAVFFICKDGYVLRKMIEVEKELCQKNKTKMYFSLLENVLQNPAEITFSKADGTHFTLR